MGRSYSQNEKEYFKNYRTTWAAIITPGAGYLIIELRLHFVSTLVRIATIMARSWLKAEGGII